MVLGLPLGTITQTVHQNAQSLIEEATCSKGMLKETLSESEIEVIIYIFKSLGRKSPTVFNVNQ